MSEKVEQVTLEQILKSIRKVIIKVDNYSEDSSDFSKFDGISKDLGEVEGWVLKVQKQVEPKIQEAIDLLAEVKEKRGAYSQDQLTHAENVINNASEKAIKVIAILKEVLGVEEEK